MSKKTDEQIIKANFNDLKETEQERFLELAIKRVNKTFEVLIPKGVKTHTIVIEDGSGCIIRHPKPHTLSKAMGAISGLGDKDPDMYRAGNIILTQCWIAGDKKFDIEGDERFALALQALQVMEIMQGSIKKN